MDIVKQRIAIAEACGWTGIEDRSTSLCSGLLLGMRPNRADYEIPQMLPNYLNDLNAMNEAEGVLNFTEAEQYEKLLRSNGDFKTHKLVWYAPAKQRAEAFLKTIGKWES